MRFQLPFCTSTPSSRGTVKVRVAGVGSATPAALTAATLNMWVPAANFSVSPPVAHGTVSPSTRHTNVAGATVEA